MKPYPLLILSLLMSPSIFASELHSVSSMQNDVDAFIKSKLDINGHYEISKAAIDPHLQLPACHQTLDIFPPSGNIKPGANTIGIRCSGDKPWTIYSVVGIKAFVEVYVLNQGLKRNELIRMDHLRKEIRDAGLLPKGYVEQPEDAINQQATRNIPAGSILTRSHFSAPTLVKRGERISIQSGKPGLLISMQGIAIMDGIKGQQIPVKNASSQRVIHATVTAPGQVTVTF